MKISSVKTVLFDKNNANNKIFSKGVSQKDGYVKSKELSFCGADDFSFNSAEHGYTMFDVFLDAVDNVRRENDFKTLIEYFSDKKRSSFLKGNKNLKMEELLKGAFRHNPLDCEFFLEKFNNAGIKTLFNFQNFLKAFNQSDKTKKAFRSNNIEALDIYGKLDNKGDLARYGELLLYLNRENTFKNDYEEKIDFNEITGFLRKIKVSDLDEFKTKFSHISYGFNDFNNISDEYQAILYLMLSYPEKIDFINKALKDNPSKGKVTPDDIYINNPDIIDYLYENNDGKNLDPLPVFINQLSSNKNSASELKKILDKDYDFLSTEDVISFLEILAESKVTLDDMKKMSRNSVISDSNLINSIDKKESIVKKISHFKGYEENKAYEVYKKYNDLLNVLFSSQDYDETRLKTFFNIIDNFNTGNSRGILDLYKDVYGTNQKSITGEQFKEFVDIMEYCPSPSFIKEAKSKKIKPIDVLNEEKEKFLKSKDEIDDFLNNDKEGYFLGLNSREVYLKYKDLFEKSDSVQSVLDNIIKLNIETSSDYKEKVDKLENIEKYCPDRKTLFEFINSAGIKLDSTKEDEDHISNCIKVLKSLKEASSDNEYNERLDYLIQSKFMMKSKDAFDEFFGKHKDNKELARIMMLMTDRKAPSVNSFEKLIKKYKGEDGNYDNILKHLENSDKDVDFKEYLRILKMFDKMFKDKNIPIKLNNDNILSIKISDLKGSDRITHKLFVQTINAIKKTKDENFLCTLKNSFINKKEKFSPFDIASEITGKVFSQGDYFHNIMSKLDINAEELTRDEHSEFMRTEKLSKSLPKEFVDFVNSNEWLNFNDNQEKIPNLSLHARLRLIDRFMLDENSSIEDLYKENSQKRAKEILKTIYTEDDINVLDNDVDNRIITITHHNGSPIKTVFAKNGKMVTIIAKGR